MSDRSLNSRGIVRCQLERVKNEVVHCIASFMRARMFCVLRWVGPSACARLVVGMGGRVGWGSARVLSAVVYALGGYVWLNFVGRSPAFRSLLVQWLFFARLEHSPISRVGRGSFGSLVLRYSARPWPLALLSEVGLALRCVLWFALVLRPLHTCTAFSSFEGVSRSSCSSR